MPYVVDTKPRRQGHFIPIIGQEVVALEFLKKLNPGHVLETNPSYIDETSKSLDQMNIKAEVV